MPTPKKKMAFRYDKTKPTEMETVFHQWRLETGLKDEPSIAEHFYHSWVDGDVQLLLSRTKGIFLISQWEVV